MPATGTDPFRAPTIRTERTVPAAGGAWQRRAGPYLYACV